MLTMTFTVMIFSLVFTSCVSAKELSQFNEYLETPLTTEHIENLIKESNLDTDKYNNYFSTAYTRNVGVQKRTYFYLFVFSDKDNYYISKSSSGYYFNLDSTSYIIKTFIVNSESNNKVSIETYTLTVFEKTNEFLNKEISDIAYYSTIDIKDTEGNIIFAKNSIDVKPLEPSTTIKKFVNFYTSFYTIVGNFCKNIISKPLLLFPLSLSILISILYVFKSLL